MSKYPQRKRPERVSKSYTPKTIVDPEKAKRIKSVLFFAVVIILAIIPFSLGKYLEFKSHGPFDSGAYVYSANHILHGAVIGVDERPTAALGTLLVNMLGVKLSGCNEIGVKFLQMLMQAAALIMMFFAMRKLFGNLPAAVGLIIASSYLSAPVIAKFGNVKEQYMIAVMVLGVSSFVFYQIKNKWWWAVLAGGFISWAPLFKPTGVSAIAAIGLFVIAQPLLKNRTWKKAGIDILLLFAGAIIAIAPLYIWIIGCDVKTSLPYKFAWDLVGKKIIHAATAVPVAGVVKESAGYIATSRKAIPLSVQAPRVLRYYMILILPVALALGSILARFIRLFRRRKQGFEDKISQKPYDKFVLLFGVWWIIDMALVWVSPRSYEEYYLPLNASAAMLSGYIVALYSDKLKATVNKPKWVFIGLAGLVCMVMMIWPIFFGIRKSPFSNTVYRDRNGEPARRNGYRQKLNELSGKGTWEYTAQYIKDHSTETDKIYVWGWYPGIYVYAQRMAPTPRAFLSEMHMMPPDVLKQYIQSQLAYFAKEKPKFIVDTQHAHAPYDGRPPLGLWPKTQKGFLPNDKNIIAMYENSYEKALEKQINLDEALRFKAMKPFRDFVMNNYKIVRTFGEQVLFELK